MNPTFSRSIFREKLSISLLMGWSSISFLISRFKQTIRCLEGSRNISEPQWFCQHKSFKYKLVHSNYSFTVGGIFQLKAGR